MQAMNPPITDWSGRSVWLIGSSSGIGLATAHALHAAGARVVVSARQSDLLTQFVLSHPDAPATRQVAQQVHTLQGLDVVVYCAGYYKAVRATHYSLPEMLRHQAVNYTGALHMLDAVLPSLLQQGHGHVSLISSVAGYRGLPQSLAYGPTKAALTHLAEALYMDLASQGLGVSVIHPGFVATPLTAQNTFKMPAMISPEQAAQAMLHGWAKGLFEIHFPKRFTRWLKLLRLLPYRWYFAIVHRATGM
jgi:NAD(P)-dependent dehydrogenase (short-subunit alcohol dehydrogenase family)